MEKKCLGDDLSEKEVVPEISLVSMDENQRTVGLDAWLIAWVHLFDNSTLSLKFPGKALHVFWFVLM